MSINLPTCEPMIKQNVYIYVCIWYSLINSCKFPYITGKFQTWNISKIPQTTFPWNVSGKCPPLCNPSLRCKIFKLFLICQKLPAWRYESFNENNLKGSYDVILKIIIWCNRICWHAFNVQKTYFSNTIHYCSSSNPCPKEEQSLVIDTMIMLVCIFSTQAAVKTISDGVCTLRCDVTMFPSHTHKVGIDPCFFRNSLHA